MHFRACNVCLGRNGFSGRTEETGDRDCQYHAELSSVVLESSWNELGSHTLNSPWLESSDEQYKAGFKASSQNGVAGTKALTVG